MASLNGSDYALLDMGAAQDFDGIAPMNLTANFGAQVETNFDQALDTISLNMQFGINFGLVLRCKFLYINKGLNYHIEAFILCARRTLKNYNL